ncbi:hypothetical protein ACHAXS_002845 [Conticribra weissflogii]
MNAYDDRVVSEIDPSSALLEPDELSPDIRGTIKVNITRSSNDRLRVSSLQLESSFKTARKNLEVFDLTKSRAPKLGLDVNGIGSSLS